MSRVCVVIVAGGKGKRMGTDVAKQYISIGGKPILYYAIKAFADCKNVDEIILVTQKDEIEYCKSQIVEKFNLPVKTIVEAGAERQDSVYNGLNSIDDCDLVLIHDAARPFVTSTIIEKGIKFAEDFGAAAPGVTPKDTIKVKGNDGFSIETPDRNTLFAVQTPQCFKYKMIKDCHEKIKNANIPVTDDTMAFEMFYNKVFLYEGDYKNIKITTPEDLILAESFINKNNQY
ncbi:2-C-methyl-D-erythritol 4-phosphate cytidylyltransferase [Clostridium manihotivorum]|uniref:2-C-methyl-D-erythritol 4-phosphate cytidylyltransferase n=1 Tax=Clostridium manihotivorum TaxID=2320868 RepID=A0A3R5QR61_9CLOT|nr:2-C-methyl-D-erythritol 4-phosphate cytidylyltransferase [Clostridium manihotivorum]QAA30796.1 2-C-methyl-D-erythritol 4-phosphate cytidylyltransferase [Clostridium manihotivorum]